MQLYYSPGACSLSPHIALREAGLAFSLHKVDLGSKKVEGGGAFDVVNAKGYVPALKLTDGHVLTEGPAIVQYIADQKPELELAPRPGTMARYKLQEWLNFVSSELHKGLGSLFNPALPKEARDIAIGRLTQRLDWLSGELGQKAHLMGDSVHRRRWLSVYRADLDQACRHRPGQMAQSCELCGAGGGAAEGPGGDEGGRAEQLGAHQQSRRPIPRADGGWLS